MQGLPKTPQEVECKDLPEKDIMAAGTKSAPGQAANRAKELRLKNDSVDQARAMMKVPAQCSIAHALPAHTPIFPCPVCTHAPHCYGTTSHSNRHLLRNTYPAPAVSDT